jgi:uncharacterized protein
MAHIATKRYSYLGQFGILMALVGAGLLIGQGISAGILISKYPAFFSNPKSAMDQLLVPANANLLRILQLISVLFMFILPALIYAKVCHKKPMVHLGIKKSISLPQLVLAVFLILSSLPLVGALREVTLHLPLGDYINKQILQSKDDYMKQVLSIGTMRNLTEYFVVLFIMALLPGIAEELIFRGGIQNLFTRWFKNPVTAILLSAVVFSLFHFEYSDFLGRVFLGAVIGWVFYLTGNLWLCIAMHAAFNAFSVTGLYISQHVAGAIGAKEVENSFSLLVTLGFAAIFVLIGWGFYKLNKQKDKGIPGQEVLLHGYEDPNNPSWTIVNTNARETI